MRNYKKGIKPILLFLISMLACSCCLHATMTNADLWTRGNAYFAQEKYDSALQCYQQIENNGKQNAALFYNLGNVYYRLGEVAPAVLYYEKALFHNPGNQQIKDNLALAQSKVALPVAPSQPVFFISWWENFLLFIIPQVWAWLMVLCFAVVLTLLYRKVKHKGALIFSGRWLALSIVGFCLSGLFFFCSYRARTHSDLAVVMVNNEPFFAHPDDGQEGGQLPEGAVVRIKNQRAGWFTVVLPNGSRAWIRSKHIRKVQE